MIYPNRLDNFTRQFLDKITQIMRFLELNHALDLVNNEIDRPVNWIWYDKLSPGEVQRLAFVRLFLYHPMITFLDEATSAISFEQEKKIYEECKRQNITVVSCGHRSTLLDYHNVILKMQTNDVSSSESSSASSWTMQRIKKS